MNHFNKKDNKLLSKSLTSKILIKGILFLKFNRGLKMRRLFKILIVLFILSIILTGFVGSILLSVNQISTETSDPAFSYHITGSIITGFDGYINVTVPVIIDNGGYYDIKGLEVTISVFIIDMEITSALDGIKTGEGYKDIGDIPGGSIWSGEVTVKIEENIAILAVQNGNLHIVIDIDVGYNIIILTVPYSTQITTDVPYSAPNHP